MVETRPGPLRRIVADRAIFREPGGYVVRIPCSVEITEMTRYTFLRFAPVDPVLVAVDTGKCRVTAG